MFGDNGFPYEDLLGIPFVPYGRDPRIGLDCWGLVLVAMRRLGVDIPDWGVNPSNPEDVALQVENFRHKFQEVSGLDTGILVLLRYHPRLGNHIGIGIGKNKFLHTVPDHGVLVSGVNEPLWARRVKGFYKWKAS